MISTRQKKTSDDSSIVVTNRTAIDPSGRIGSLYDGYRDRILGCLNVKDEDKLYQSHKNLQCKIIRNHNYQTENIFQLLSIDEQLRLSILLELTSKTGIVSLIDYPHMRSDYTRLFCYSCVYQKQQVPDRREDAQVFIKSSEPNTEATHIITSIDWGIDFVVILELPHDTKLIVAIDRVLDRVRTILQNDYSMSTLSMEEEELLKMITYTKVYSHVSDLRGVEILRDVCRYIEQNKYASNMYRPISYTIRPIKWLYPYYTGQSSTYISLPGELSNNIEWYVMGLRDDIGTLEMTLYNTIPKLLCGHLKKQLYELQKQWSIVKMNCKNEIERLSRLVMNARQGRILMPMIDQEVKKNKQSIKDNIDDLTHYLNDLQEKGKLITKLMKYRFEYLNVVDYGIDGIDNEITIERKLVLDEHRYFILCSNDALNKTRREQLRNLRRDIVKEFNNNPGLHLIYADFSYCSFKLQNIMKLPSNKYGNERRKAEPKETTSFRESQNISSSFVKTRSSLVTHKETQTSTFLPTNVQSNTLLPTKTLTTFDSTRTNLQSTGPFLPNTQPDILTQSKLQIPISVHTKLLSDNHSLNILLLGETGVGKSTFINAFANYLTFNTLQQAETGHPVVLIPVSFIITVGDNFDEHIIKFGDINHSKNENFDHPGQSVTQRCKSYIFNLNHADGKKLCIIDTPGFGDTHGIDQDNLNMQHILEYIKTFSHLNAVCFLLKPNESRLNIFFRSCFTQLFSLFANDIGNRIIFCFTNARSTFYTPGNTAPLLKRLLNSLAINNIPFTKTNTFCFDSESFRYLVALKNNIQFTSLEKKEYETSWTKSVIESNHLIRYIYTNLTAYPLFNKR